MFLRFYPFLLQWFPLLFLLITLVQKRYKPISQPMIVIILVSFLFSFTMNQEKPFELMLFKQNWQGSFQEIYPSVKVDHIKQIINCFLQFISLLRLLPIWMYSSSFQHFVYKLGQHLSKIEIFEDLTIEIFFCKSKLEEKSAKNRNKNE